MSPLAFAFFVSVILAVVLAVARDIPMHLAAFPKGISSLGFTVYAGAWLTCLALFALGKAAADDRMLTASGVMSMAVLWWLAAWNLWRK